MDSNVWASAPMSNTKVTIAKLHQWPAAKQTVAVRIPSHAPLRAATESGVVSDSSPECPRYLGRRMAPARVARFGVAPYLAGWSNPAINLAPSL